MKVRYFVKVWQLFFSALFPRYLVDFHYILLEAMDSFACNMESLNKHCTEIQKHEYLKDRVFFSSVPNNRPGSYVIIIRGMKSKDLVEKWHYSLSSLVENEKEGMKLKFELFTPWGVELTRTKRQIF